VDDYREALFGWYAAIQHAHACVVRAARWFATAQPSDFRRPETFTDWMSGTRGRRSSGTAEETDPAAQRALQEIILMMHAWSPHTFEAIDVAFQRAEGEAASHAWGGSFEPAGRPEAQAAAEALASVLTPRERRQVRDVIDQIETDDEDRDMDLAKDNTLACTSDRHRTYGAESGGREACATARGRVYEEASQSWSDRIRTALAAARAAVARDTTETTPQVWHDNAQLLREAREAAGLDLHDAAGHLGIKSATLERFEQAAGKLPGRPVSLSYLQLLTLTCIQAGRTAPACIPQAVSDPVISLPTTL
jgi:chromosome segregation and condensation protein ScpB